MITNELKKAVMAVLLEDIQRSNAEDGFCAPVSGWGDVRSHNLLRENGIKLETFAVMQHGRKVATIRRNYASRAVRLCYKELKPTIIWEAAA